jgi:hypothetical protein
MIFREPQTLEAATSGRYAFGPVSDYTPAGTKWCHYWQEYVSPLEITLKEDLQAGDFYDLAGHKVNQGAS